MTQDNTRSTNTWRSTISESMTNAIQHWSIGLSYRSTGEAARGTTATQGLATLDIMEAPKRMVSTSVAGCWYCVLRERLQRRSTLVLGRRYW